MVVLPLIKKNTIPPDKLINQKILRFPATRSLQKQKKLDICIIKFEEDTFK